MNLTPFTARKRAFSIQLVFTGKITYLARENKLSRSAKQVIFPWGRYFPERQAALAREAPTCSVAGDIKRGKNAILLKPDISSTEIKYQ